MQPFACLGRALADAGHAVELTSSANGARMARAAGLPFRRHRPFSKLDTSSLTGGLAMVDLRRAGLHEVRRLPGLTWVGQVKARRGDLSNPDQDHAHRAWR